MFFFFKKMPPTWKKIQNKTCIRWTVNKISSYFGLLVCHFFVEISPSLCLGFGFGPCWGLVRSEQNRVTICIHLIAAFNAHQFTYLKSSLLYFVLFFSCSADGEIATSCVYVTLSLSQKKSPVYSYKWQ